MKKLRKNKTEPKLFSEHFGVDPERLKQLGVFDPILNVDTRLFVDPVLLKNSTHEMIRKGFDAYRKFFGDLIRLLQMSEEEGDRCWRAAQKLVYFPEYKFTCIGYGANTIDGSGSGAALNDQILQSAKEILKFAQDSPDIFLLLPLLEGGIGADRISDMTQNIIDGIICSFTSEIMEKLRLVGNCWHTARDGERYHLLQNPYSKAPIKLLPNDILSDLPTAENIDVWLVNEVSENENLRDQVNRLIGQSFEEATKKEKKQTLLNALKSDHVFFLEVLEALKEYSFEHYDVEKDHKGLYRWLKDSETLVEDAAPSFSALKDSNLKDLLTCVESIISVFRSLIEQKEIWRIFWTEHHSGVRHVNEFYSYMLFYMACEHWVSSSGSTIHLHREVNKDTKHAMIIFSWEEYQVRVLVKHSNNAGLEKSYTGESILSTAEHPTLYVIMNFAEKDARQLNAIKQAAHPHCRIIEIDVAKEKLGENDLFDFELLGFDDLDLLEDLYTEEKRRGGRSSHKIYQPLKAKVKELCEQEMQRKMPSSALQLCKIIARIIKDKHTALLENFEPYKKYIDDGTDWTDRTFYEWCNDAFKSHKR